MATPEERTGESHELSLDVRKTVLGLVLALLLAGAAFTVLGQVTHFGRLQRAVSHADKVWLLPVILGQLLAYLGYALGYRDAASANGGPRFGFFTTARIVIFGAGAAVLGASVGGLAVDYWALRRTGTKQRVAARRVLAVGTLEWTVLALYALAAGALVLVTGVRAPLAMTLGWLILVPACVAGAVWFSAPERVRRFIDLPPAAPTPQDAGRALRAWRYVERKLRVGLANGIAGVVFVRHLTSHPLRYWGAAVGYPIYWAGDMLTLYAAVHAFGIAADPISLILAYATGIVISSLPLPAGGAGGVEATIALALHGTGIPMAPALLGVFVYRIVTFWLPILPALALIPSMRRLHDSLPSVGHTPRDGDEGVSFRPAADAAT